MAELTRRELLASSTSALAAAALLDACQGSTPVATGTGAEPDAPPNRLPAFSFTDAQRRALGAAVAQIVPAQNAGDWSAADAGAVEYIERLLNTFSDDQPTLYGGGPVRANFAGFHSMPRAKALGWQREVLRLRELYASGLDELNRLARGTLAVLPGDFAALPALAQEALLDLQDVAGNAFFAALFAHTLEAVYSHPVYGGNKDYIGWQSVGYAGDVHGVRFPGGFDPAADAEPWRKFGGYSADEIPLPGTGEGPTT
jgi:gluconate 2-dehydrogenase gamma chain